MTTASPRLCPRRIRLRQLTVLVIGVVLIQSVHAAKGNSGNNGNSGGGCDSSVENQVKGTSFFQACSAATRLTFDKPKKNEIDSIRAAFCQNPTCLRVYLRLQSIGGLYCLAAYSSASIPLDQDSGGPACFGPAAFSPPTLAPTAPPTPAPTEEPTEPPTVPPTPPPTPPPTEAAAGSDSGEDDNSSQEGVSSTFSSAHISSRSSSYDSTSLPPPIASGNPDQIVQSNMNNPNSSDGGSGLSPLKTLLVVVVAMLVAAAAGVACFVQYRRLASNGRKPRDDSAYVQPAKSTREQRAASKTHDGSTSSESSLVSMQSHHQINISFPSSATDSVDSNDDILSSCRLPYEKLVFGEPLSQGGFGVVYCGTYRDQIVAIKTLLPEHRKSARHIQGFLHEIRLLASLEHERIVQFIGVAWDSLNEISVVMEFMERGDLRCLLDDYEANGHQQTGFDGSKVKIALQISHALTYLHSLEPVVLHRDLKSRNILLDTQLNAKITDFGVSREHSDCTMTAGVGSSLWMAPEVMLGERYDEKADIFSFGVLLSEMDLHSSPYSHARESQSNGHRLPDTTILQMVSMGLLAVAFTDEDHSAVAQLGRECVSLDPVERPSVSEVLHRLHVVHQKCTHAVMAPPGALV